MCLVYQLPTCFLIYHSPIECSDGVHLWLSIFTARFQVRSNPVLVVLAQNNPPQVFIGFMSLDFDCFKESLLGTSLDASSTPLPGQILPKFSK